ncbi:MAG: NAD(P)/FAD-dependent oxidoreductase [Candidatus Kapaibacteriales bacterium]
MGSKYFDLKLPTDYSDSDIRRELKKALGTSDFDYQLEKQSLDARSKNIHWQVRVVATSDSIKTNFEETPPFQLPKYIKDSGKVAVVGSGPAGFYCAYLLQLSGFDVTLFERGPEVFERIKKVKEFEKGGPLDERANYAYGEGGAGTFSDGKLTSRTKSIVKERKWIFEQYIEAGAPPEIRYLSKPHIGSNLLVKTAKNLRKKFLSLGGRIHFDTDVVGLNFLNGTIQSIETEKGQFEADHFIFATGHSSYPVYRMLIEAGAKFTNKPFAIGARIEHRQELINMAKWRKAELPGVKAADYALTHPDSPAPVYSFCMCPGGMVVPAPTNRQSNIVNGMSNYKRNYPFANSAIVAGIYLPQLLDKELSPMESLDWLTSLEKKFYDYADGYSAPAVKASDLLNGNSTSTFPDSSYPFNRVTADFTELFPKIVVESMKIALQYFEKKISGFGDGILMGLESRTSSPIQAMRGQGGLLDGFTNLYMAGEGSGYSGGIVSSAADGLLTAVHIAESR